MGAPSSCKPIFKTIICHSTVLLGVCRSKRFSREFGLPEFGEGDVNRYVYGNVHGNFNGNGHAQAIGAGEQSNELAPHLSK